MKIHLESSGGFAGIVNSFLLDTESMRSEEKQKMQGLIKTVDFFNLPAESEIKPKPGSADYVNYKITVEEGHRRHTIRINDITMSPRLRDLVAFLESKTEKSNLEL
jgi:hypothetical protein